MPAGHCTSALQPSQNGEAMPSMREQSGLGRTHMAAQMKRPMLAAAPLDRAKACRRSGVVRPVPCSRPWPVPCLRPWISTWPAMPHLTCGRIGGRSRVSARRAARRSRRPATWVSTCGRIPGRSHMSVRHAARLSPSPAIWVCTCGRIRVKNPSYVRRAARRSRGPKAWLCTCVRIRGRNPTYVRCAARRSRSPTACLGTCGPVRSRTARFYENRTRRGRSCAWAQRPLHVTPAAGGAAPLGIHPM